LGSVRKDVTKFISDLDAKAKLTRDQMMTSLIKLSKEEVNTKRGVIGKTSSGKPIYEKAIPGEPAHKRTGNLQRSITGTKATVGFANYTAIVGPQMIYGRRLELGGGNWQSGIKFPYMSPAYQKFRPIAEAIIKKNLGI
jgi:hypothetical protein